MDRRGEIVERFVGPQEQNIRDHLVDLAVICHMGEKVWKLLLILDSQC